MEIRILLNRIIVVNPPEGQPLMPCFLGIRYFPHEIRPTGDRTVVTKWRVILFFNLILAEVVLDSITPRLDFRNRIYWALTGFRDNEYLPEWIVDIIDWLRYEVFYED